MYQADLVVHSDNRDDDASQTRANTVYNFTIGSADNERQVSQVCAVRPSTSVQLDLISAPAHHASIAARKSGREHRNNAAYMHSHRQKVRIVNHRQTGTVLRWGHSALLGQTKRVLE